MMRVHIATEKAPNSAANEDAAFVRGDLVGVLDGVSVPDGLETGCLHTAAWYVECLAGQLCAAYDKRPLAPLTELLATAICAVRTNHAGTCDLTHPSTPAATVCLLRVRQGRADYLVLCDATLVLDFGKNVQVVTDGRFSQVIAEVRQSAFAGTPAIGSLDQRERVRQASIKRQQFTNQSHGYWIAAAMPQAASHAVTGSAPLVGPCPARSAVLLTDGAADAVDRYHLLDWRGLVDLLNAQGPKHLIRLVRAAENADTYGQQQPRYKSHDDATAALCLFEEDQP